MFIKTINNGQVIKSTKGLTPSQVNYNQTKKGYRLPTESEWEQAINTQGKNISNNVWEWCFDSCPKLADHRVIHASSWFGNHIDGYHGGANYLHHIHYLEMRIVYNK